MKRILVLSFVGLSGCATTMTNIGDSYMDVNGSTVTPKLVVDCVNGLISPSICMARNMHSVDSNGKTSNMLIGEQLISGDSAAQQLAGPAATGVGMYFIGQGLEDSGDSVNASATGGNARSSANASASAAAKAKAKIVKPYSHHYYRD